LPSMLELTDLEAPATLRRHRRRRKKAYRKPRFRRLRQKLQRKKGT